MPPGRRQGGGCWTCRLRRKRCDSIEPVCGSCQDLEITCFSGRARPMWMDGAAEQKQMSEKFKEMIKQNALLRRERRGLTHEDEGMIIVNETEPTVHQGTVLPDTSHANDVVVEDALLTNSMASTHSTTSAGSITLQSSNDQFEESQSSLTSTPLIFDPLTPSVGSSTGISWPNGPAVPISMQLGSVMTYLDYVFPFLFPFYQPSLIETGRQWLLGLLCQNEVSFHVAASLSAYFFTLAPHNVHQDMHADCKALVRDQLFKQMDMAVKSIQCTVSAISYHGAQNALLDKVRLMEEILQLLFVEITVQRDVDWKMHLTPALALFDQIFKDCGMDHSGPSLAVLLNALPLLFPMAALHHKPLPNTADQSALMFFVSLLLFVDTVASTSIGAAPTLQGYHHTILSSHNKKPCRVKLETVVGCQNWVLVAIGDISALCAWKRNARRSGDYSVVDLVELAAPITQALEQGLASLNVSETHPRSQTMGVGLLQGYYSRHDKAIDSTTIANITRVWAYAAKIYLSISLSGWQTIKSPAQLRSLSWPICVAGCLALSSHEDDFRNVVNMMGQLTEFGTMNNALLIMEAVWSSRDTVDRDSWDIAACLRITGSPVLLL